MKKIILSIAILLSTLAGMSQSNEYESAMGEALSQYPNCKTVEDFQSLGNRFSLIANAEKTEWLPLYYYAHCYILMSFTEASDEKKKDGYLDVAETQINKMIELAPKESEVYALQSLLYSARLIINPMFRGQKYGALSAQAVGKSLELDPDNPRAKFVKLRNDVGTARFFGRDTKEYCSQASELLSNWDNYKLKAPLYPSWGKKQVTEIMAECKY